MSFSPWRYIFFSLGLAAVLAAGCHSGPNGGLGLPFFHRPRPAEYPLASESNPRTAKAATVALFVAVELGGDEAVPGIESRLAANLAHRLPDLAGENGQKLTVIDPVVVDKFKLKTPDWKLMHASTCGEKLGVDFVVVVRINSLSLAQSGAREASEGRADVVVNVYDVAAGPVGARYTYEIPFQFPRPEASPAAAIPIRQFRQEFVETLANEIAMKHFPSR